MRYERKFQAPDLTIDQVLMVVKSHPAHFVECFPERRVNNVYFDTTDLSAYRAHVLGSSRRRKVRIRWYGEAFGGARSATIEVKTRIGNVGNKQHHDIPPFDFDGSIQMDFLRSSTAAGTPAESMGAYFACATPALFNSYVRRYYQSADRRYRITIDTEMEFRTVNGFAHSHVSSNREQRLQIVELKYDVYNDSEVHRIVNCLPFRVSKFSKYVSGMERLRCCAN